MATIRFITSGDLTSITVIQKNVQASLLEPFIDTAQLHIRDVLGLAQYEALCNDVSANGLSGVTGSNSTLLTKIKPALCFATWLDAMPFLDSKFTNKGIVHKDSENSTTVDDAKFIRLMSAVKNWKEKYTEELLIFLRNNKDTYSLWREDVWEVEQRYSGATTSNSKLRNRGGIIFDRYYPNSNGYDDLLNKYN